MQYKYIFHNILYSRRLTALKFKRILLIVVIITCFMSTSKLCVLAVQKEKVIYLTFDDGPTKKNTPKVLEILKQENILATFFLIGTNVEQYPDVARTLKENNMAIGAHSYSHVTGDIYKSAYNYKTDIKKCCETIKEIIGEEPINITRMPCGSTNKIASPYIKKEIKNTLREMNLNYIDWNVSGEDAITRNIPPSVIFKNIMKDSNDKDVIVLLLHDAYYSSTTVEVLPKVIKYFKQNGYVFKTLKNLSEDEMKVLEDKGILNKKK